MSQLSGIKVAILVANGFEQIELENPKQALEKAGAETSIVSAEKDQVQGWHHYEKADYFTIDIPLAQAKADDFDALLLPGGVANPDTLRTLPEAIQFIKEFNNQNKPIAAICHGPWTLINAKAVNGRRMTSWASLQCDLENAGAHWVDEAMVRDGNIVTSRKPDDLPQFNEAMIQLFGS